MAKKVFKSKFFLDTFYKVVDEKWLDNKTYVLVFQDMEDGDDDIYHLEVEYHKDENKITYTRVYEHETIDAAYMVTCGFKKQFEEYILQQVGVIDKNDIILEDTISVTIKVAVPLDMRINEHKEWLDNLSVQVTNSFDSRIKVLDITKRNGKNCNV